MRITNTVWLLGKESMTTRRFPSGICLTILDKDGRTDAAIYASPAIWRKLITEVTAELGVMRADSTAD